MSNNNTDSGYLYGPLSAVKFSDDFNEVSIPKFKVLQETSHGFEVENSQSDKFLISIDDLDNYYNTEAKALNALRKQLQEECVWGSKFFFGNAMKLSCVDHHLGQYEID